MPELPEVETIKTELSNVIIGKTLVSINQLYNNTVSGKLSGKSTVTNINRHGKYLVIQTKLNNIVVHLRMTGKLIYGNKIGKHTRAVFNFLNSSTLIFDDIRTFGNIQILPIHFLPKQILNLGKEPLDKSFNLKYLIKKLKNRKAAIKSILLNQSIVAGLGNIYVCEILYRAKVLPTKSVKSITNIELKNIIKHTKQVLAQAISCNGTTISDYTRVDNKKGSFQNFLQVYQKELCPKNHKIQKIKQAGRTTYFCPVCQK